MKMYTTTMKFTLTLLTVLLLAPLSTLHAVEPITIDLAKRTWQGIPGLERTAKGRVFVSWFTGGTKEPAPENTVVLSHSDDGGKTFSAPQAMALPLSDGTRCYDPCLWIDPKGRLWYLFNRSVKDSNQHGVYARICDVPDASPSVWGAEFRVGFDGPFSFRMNKPIALSTGEWIMPVTHALEPVAAWAGFDPKQVQGVGISTDEGKTWTLHGAVRTSGAALENMIVELRDGRLWMLIRTGGFLWESHSADRGRTWTDGKPTNIATPHSRFFIRRLASGNLLLVNHYKFTGRSHLTAQLSTDDGATWNEGLLLDDRSGVSYPDGVQDKDGLIWVTYDRDRQGLSEILLAKFKEEDVFAGKNVSGAVSLKQVVNKLNKPTILPLNWDPKVKADKVLVGLLKVTAPQAKGAHDAEFVCLGDRAYIVEHDNDVEPGHGAGAAQYCVLSIVNLKTLDVEKIIPMAKSEQVFNNVTLPKGMCFVPRIIQKDKHTLRTYFCSQPEKEQAVTWYRDFDLPTLAFEGSIHKAKLKTAAGLFDMEPRYFYADAVAQGFTKLPVNHGLYIFDSFKEIDGKRYVALNNFPGKQNALAVLHDDFETFEIIGHYNEPQAQQLSESAVNRLPDGTWMAICRNDAGNYHFTTSKDGKTWTVGQPMPFVPNGLNSKPTFDKFGDVYYLGWQENTKVEDCGRSVFNVDISRDGRIWERKYRFETPNSFQYPTFHEHEGAIWFTVTQSDHKGSTDRIMFGKLEDLPKPPVKVTQELLNSIHVTPKLIFDPFPAYAQKYLPFAMASSMESTQKGRLWTCWAGGQDGPNAYLLASYSDDQGKSWRDPVFVTDPQAQGLKMGTRLGSFWCDPRGRLWLFFHQSVGMFDGSCSNWFVRCDDPDAEKPVWTEPVYIGFGASLNKPIVRKNGEWILPVSLWERWHIDKPFADCYHELDAVRGANVFVSDDEGVLWRYRGGIIFNESNFNEHSVVELNDGRLWMFSRCKKETAQSFSSDGGKTWEPQSTAFPHVNSKSVFRRLQSGSILLIRHGQDITKATPARQELTAFLSTDEGKTWPFHLLLDERTGVSYPDIAQAPNGDIYVHYDRNRSSDAEILFARFREEDVKAGKLVSKDASLKNIVKSKQLGMNRSAAGNDASPESALILWDSIVSMPKAADLPQVEGAEFHVIKHQRPDTDGCKWTLGVGLAWHKGKLYASYGFNKGGENTATEEAHVRVSSDRGKTWGPPIVMDHGEGNLGVSHGVFLSHKGRLWAFMGSFYDNFQRTHTRAYTLNKITRAWEPQGVVIDKGFWPMQEPQKMADGNWIMAGARVSHGYAVEGDLPAVAISKGDDFTRWEMVVIPAAPGLGNIWGESTVILEGKRILNIARYGAKAVALLSVSDDYGRTWTHAAPSNLPMATSKPYAGILSNGQRYLVCTTTANTGHKRSPLTIAVSKPGESVFSKVFLIRTSVFEDTPGVSDPKADFSYPYAIQHKGKLYIGYTHKSHAANELAVIPIRSLEIKP